MNQEMRNMIAPLDSSLSISSIVILKWYESVIPRANWHVALHDQLILITRIIRGVQSSLWFILLTCETR